MTKTELKEARERYFLNSKRIKEITANGLIQETSEQQEKRIKHLLKPENYLEFFDYYFGVDSGLSLADAPCAKFHLESYLDVFNNRFIKQQRRWFRGAAKSIHSNVGNVTHLKQNDEIFFGLIICKTEKHSKLLIYYLQIHLE